MNRPRHFDRKGQPITFEEWGRMFESPGYRVIEQTHFGDGSMVSTIWLGLDHGFGAGGDPVIFETLDLPGHSIQMRYSTEKEARAGHALAVAQYLALRPELSQ